MNLFTEFANISTTYSPHSFQQKYPAFNTPQNNQIESTSPNKPYELIKNGDLVGYFWYQGNSIDLVFDISGTITLQSVDKFWTVNDIAKTLQFEVYMYDFRGIRILEYTNNNLTEKQLLVDVVDGLDNATVTVQIDSATSAQLAKGVYKFELIASHSSGYRETLFSKDSAIFEVR